MGKRRNKNKADRDFAVFSSVSHKTVVEVGSDDSDNASCVTHLTLDYDTRSADEEDLSDTVTPSDQLDGFLDKATNKNISIRFAAMGNIKTLLTEKYIAVDLEKWTATLIYITDKALRKTDKEAKIAASLSILISIQLGEKIASEMEPVVSLLCQLCTDPARNIQLRSHCACSVALCTFLCLEQPTSILASIATLRSIWVTAKSSAASVELFCAALSGWSLLIHQGGREALRVALLDEPKLSTFLDGIHLEMRLSAGKALAVLHEAAVMTFGDKYRFPNQQHLLDIFANLITDSLKSRAKKDRKVQKFTFRQMYASIKEQEAPIFDVRFGDETLSINSCRKKLLYEFICDALHGSIISHLKMNAILREQFDLRPTIEIFPVKMEKLRRVAIQNAINKTRDLQRLKQRDKRTVY
uniref:Interferon-related developmental regulator N-terminal domain-containing protein n=1 Tax=Wuchereria bancrofti TaxID=6293 RepID=A0AAF5PH92_WUCBA